MEELFNVALVIMCGFINPKLNNLKMKYLKYYPKSNDNILENKKDDQDNEKSSKTEETNNLEKFANTEASSHELINENKKTTFSVSKFLSYFLVFLITFIALIIVLDTFKSPLSSIIPGLEIFLYNFFETLKDLYLFIKNLLS
jgi:small-conductance mechanosensitive channel